MWAKNKHKGFTIVELLIVIVVIAILATISIVAYNGIQNRAYGSSAQSDLANAAKKAEIYKINASNDAYPISLANLISADLKFSKGSYDALVICANSSTPTIWGIVADIKDGKSYMYSSITKSITEFTANKVQGTSGGTTCPAAGIGGSWTWILQVPTGAWAF